MTRPLHKPKRVSKPPPIILTLGVLFLLISGGAVFQGYKQFQATLDEARQSDAIVARMTAMVMEEHKQAILESLKSYASRPLFVHNVKNRDINGVHLQLADLKKNNDEMDLLFVTDRKGLLWANHPVFPEAIGHDLSDRDWYRGVSADWQPYISNVFQLIVGDTPLAVAAAVPILDTDGNVIGVLADSNRLATIDKIFNPLHVDTSETVCIIDRVGNIIYNSKNSNIDRIAAYPLQAEVENASGKEQTEIEIIDANDGQKKKYLAIAPTDIGWTVVVERSLQDTLRLEYRRFFRTAAIAILLFLLIAAYTVYQNSLHEKALALLQLERQLGQSEKRYKNLIDNIPDIIYSFSDRHTDDYYSSQVESVLGYTSEYLSTHPALWHESIHPEHLPQVNQAIQDAKNGRKVELEYRIYDVFGECHWLADHMTSITDENGETVITGLAIDITDRKSLAEQRQAALNLLQNIADRVPGVVFQCRLSCDGSFSFPFVSKGLLETYRISPEEVRKDAAKVFAAHHPDDRDGIIASLHKSAQEVTPWAHEYRAKLADGTERWMSGSAVPQREENGSTLWHGVITDVTERRQMEDALRESEAHFSTAAKVARFGVYSYDFGSRIGYYSPELLALFGLPPGAQLELDDDLIAKALHPDDKPDFLEQVKAALNPCGTGILEHEYRIIRTDGKVRWLKLIGKIFFSGTMPGDRPLSATGIVQDITERKQAEEQLRIINDELERRVEQRTRELQETQAHYLHAEKLSAIGKLSASIAHEFNSPLQAVMTVLKGLKLSAKLEAEERKLLQAAIEESERMKSLIWSLRDFNRPSSGRKMPMDVHATIDSLLLLCKSDFNRKKISTVLNYADRLPQTLAIPDQIKQVFLNLLNNAADACLENGGVITISTWHEDDKVAVAIKDTGIGIPPEKIDLIFQPFYTTKPEIKGTGLGLSICHGIVRNHNGEIRVESQPGQGSTFTVLLPVNEA